MRRFTRLSLASTVCLSTLGLGFVFAGCGGDDTSVPPEDAATSDGTVPTTDGSPGVDATPGGDSGEDATTNDAAGDAAPGLDAGSDGDATVTDGSGGGDGSSGDAAADAADASDASDADAGDAADASDAADADAGPAPTAYRLVGRWDTTSTAGFASADWPGTGIEVHFSGSGASLLVALDASSANVAVDVYTGTVTGGLSATATRYAVPQTGTLTITPTTAFSGTAANPNVVAIYKAVDGEAGTLKLNTTTPFTYPGTGTNVPFAYSFKHTIEFIGDDVTAGTGDIGACVASPTTTSSPATSDENASYSFLVSQYFSAEHTTIAEKSVGVGVDNNGNSSATGLLIDKLWKETNPNSATPLTWSTASFQPEVVVFNLAGADYFQINRAGAGDETAATYEADYETLISDVHTAYPAARLLLTYGPSYSGTKASIKTYTDAIVAHFSGTAGYTIADLDLTTVVAEFGCNYKTDVNDNAKMATAVETTLAAAPFNLAP